MKHTILVAITIASLGHSAYAMNGESKAPEQVAPQASAAVPLQNSIIFTVDLRKDADRLVIESTRLMSVIRQASEEPQTASNTDNWVELLKSMGALKLLAKHNVVPTGSTRKDMDAAFAEVDSAYKLYQNNKQLKTTGDTMNALVNGVANTLAVVAASALNNQN